MLYKVHDTDSLVLKSFSVSLIKSLILEPSLTVNLIVENCIHHNIGSDEYIRQENFKRKIIKTRVPYCVDWVHNNTICSMWLFIVYIG